jgi:hypothetical protein
MGRRGLIIWTAGVSMLVPGLLGISVGAANPVPRQDRAGHETRNHAAEICEKRCQSGPKPILRHDRAVNGMRNYAKEVCAGRCESWKVSKCRRVGPRYFGCHFVGRLPDEEVCRAGLSAHLVPFIGGGGASLALGASFSEDSCPSGLFVPPGAEWRAVT